MGDVAKRLLEGVLTIRLRYPSLDGRELAHFGVCRKAAEACSIFAAF